MHDWASLPALLLLLSIFFFIANPIGSAFSRYQEPDQYGLEVTHGLTPDSGQVAAQAFNLWGDVDLADPEPNSVDVFLFYSPGHPGSRAICSHVRPVVTGRLRRIRQIKLPCALLARSDLLSAAESASMTGIGFVLRPALADSFEE